MNTQKMNEKLIKVGIVGISGYSGEYLLKLLLKHPNVRITYASANNTEGKVEDIFPALKGQTSLNCVKYNSKDAIESSDLLFLAVPHTAAMDIAPDLLKAKKKVIDLSADYRHDDAETFKKWYEKDHKDKANLKKAVYGLPELYRKEIKNAQLIANPGCYPTGAILSLAPMVASKTHSISSIIIDAKSGVTGAGRKVAASFLFGEVNENFKAYKVLNHQHTPEIDAQLSKVAKSNVSVTFIPHLLPINQGILETIYVQIKEKIKLDEIYSIYNKFYKTEPFVRILKPGAQPEIKHVANTNFCDIALNLDEEKNLLVIITAFDNLVKGAAGQAVQNMNIMYGFEETAGLL